MLNKVMLIGNVGQDPEVRHLDNNSAVTTIRVATSENFTDKNTGERRTITEWHNVVLWRQLAEFAEKFVHKGSQVFIEGKLRTRTWDDKDGQKHSTTEVVADVIRLLGSREQQPSQSATAATPEPQPATAATPTSQSTTTATTATPTSQSATPTVTAEPATAPATSSVEDSANDDLPF